MAGVRSIKMGEINVTSSRHAKSHQAHDFSRKHHDVARKSSSWWKSPETRRKKRVARYKLYAVEGRVKYSVKKGFRWVKKTFSRFVH